MCCPADEVKAIPRISAPPGTGDWVAVFPKTPYTIPSSSILSSLPQALQWTAS